MPWTDYSPKSCVYIIFVDDRIHYIGQTSSLESRMEAHRSYALHGIDSARIRVKYKIVQDVDARLKLEARLLRRYRPKANKLIPVDKRKILTKKTLPIVTREMVWPKEDWIKLPSRMK